MFRTGLDCDYGVVGGIDECQKTHTYHEFEKPNYQFLWLKLERYPLIEGMNPTADDWRVGVSEDQSHIDRKRQILWWRCHQKKMLTSNHKGEKKAVITKLRLGKK